MTGRGMHVSPDQSDHQVSRKSKRSFDPESVKTHSWKHKSVSSAVYLPFFNSAKKKKRCRIPHSQIIHFHGKLKEIYFEPTDDAIIDFSVCIFLFCINENLKLKKQKCFIIFGSRIWLLCIPLHKYEIRYTCEVSISKYISQNLCSRLYMTQENV